MIELPIGVLVVAAGEPTANARALELLGRGASDDPSLVGAALTSVNGEEFAGLAAVVARDEAARLVVGPERIVELAPAGASGSAEVWLVRDATAEQRRLERQLLARGTHASLGRLTAGVVHELNNHLFALLGTVEMLMLEPPADEQQAERLRRLQHTALELRELAAALSAGARPQADPPRLVALASVTGEALALVGRSLLARDVELVEQTDLAPCPIVASEHELARAIAELVLDAGQAVVGGGTVCVGTRPHGSVAELTIVGEPVDPDLGAGGLAVATAFAAVRRAGGVGRAERGSDGAIRFTLELPLAAESSPAP